MKVDFRNYKDVVERWLLKQTKNKTRPMYVKQYLKSLGQEQLDLLNNKGGLRGSKLFKKIYHWYNMDEFDEIDNLLSNDDSILRMGFNLNQISDLVLEECVIEVQSENINENSIYRIADENLRMQLINGIKKLIKLEEIIQLSEELQNQNKAQTNELEDWSNTKAVEKLIFLNELGILEILKMNIPFNTSTNSLAMILSAITGENSTTLQSSLSAMNRNNKNDPYNSKKLVNKTKSKLAQLKYEQNPQIATLLGKK